MNRYAVISGGKVQNVVLAEAALDDSYVLIPDDLETVSIDWLYDGSAFAAPPLSPEEVQAQIDAARQLRNDKLRNEVDPIICNPFRWADLSEQKKQAMLEYRTALLDITDQSGFPDEIVWPSLVWG